MCHQTKLNERWRKSQRFRKSILRKMPALRVLQTTIQERITAKDISGGTKFQSKRRHSKHCRVQISWKPFYRMLITNETRFQGRCFTFFYLSDAYFKKNWWHFKKHNRKKHKTFLKREFRKKWDATTGDDLTQNISYCTSQKFEVKKELKLKCWLNTLYGLLISNDDIVVIIFKPWKPQTVEGSSPHCDTVLLTGDCWGSPSNIDGLQLKESYHWNWIGLVRALLVSRWLSEGDKPETRPRVRGDRYPRETLCREKRSSVFISCVRYLR